MNGVTEIYICKPGQAIKEGKLEYSSSVRTRADANIDSVRRCKADPSIALVTYYAVDERGKFRTLYSYKNPRVGKAPKRRVGAGATQRTPSEPRKRRALKPTLLERILTAIESK